MALKAKIKRQNIIKADNIQLGTLEKAKVSIKRENKIVASIRRVLNL